MPTVTPDRTALDDDLTLRYGPLMDQAGLPKTDTPDGYGSVLDRVMSIYTVRTDLDVNAAFPIAQYLLLDLLCDLLTVAINFSDTGTSASLSQIYANASAERKRLQARVGWLVDPVLPTTAGLIAMHWRRRSFEDASGTEVDPPTEDDVRW